jgi:hypothetical protein
MSDAGRKTDTPLPGSRANGKRNALGIVSVLGIIGGAITVLVYLGVPSPSDVLTKTAAKSVTDKIESDVASVSVKLEAHAAQETARVGKLETDTAVLGEQARSVGKALDRFDRVIEAQTANIETLMRAVEVPERSIRKARAPRDEDR